MIEEYSEMFGLSKAQIVFYMLKEYPKLKAKERERELEQVRQVSRMFPNAVWKEQNCLSGWWVVWKRAKNVLDVRNWNRDLMWQIFNYGLKDITKLDDFNQVVDWGNSSFQ